MEDKDFVDWKVNLLHLEDKLCGHTDGARKGVNEADKNTAEVGSSYPN